MDNQDVFSYITTEKNNWLTTRVKLTNSKDWNMSEHIERCYNVANGWFHKGKNDGMRPYDDIAAPIIDVAFRSEGFDVKDIIPYVNDAANYYKSFLVKKYHPRWARRNELDTFIDEVVETSVIYDLAIVKDVNETKPEVIDLKSIAFCNQKDVLASPICTEHDYSVTELMEMKGTWEDEAIDRAYQLLVANNPKAGELKVYELRGRLPSKWLDETAKRMTYKDQVQIVTMMKDANGQDVGTVLYKGISKPLKDVFKVLKIDQVRSKGRACGKSIVERLFEPVVWNNYAGIKLKALLDSAINVLITDSDEIANQKLSDLKNNQILKQGKGDNTYRLDGSLQNLPALTNYQMKQANDARMLGSASEASLGKNPNAGTPFALQSLIVQEGDGIHVYRQGKIATFFADVLYRDLILKYLVDEMNQGQKFSEDLTLDELADVADAVVANEVEEEIKNLILDNKIPPPDIREQLTQVKKAEFMKGGTRRFMEVMKDELKDVPVDVFVSITGKQKRLAENADKLTNTIRAIIENPQAFSQIPGIGKAFNELLEASGMSPIDFTSVTNAPPAPVEPQLATA